MNVLHRCLVAAVSAATLAACAPEPGPNGGSVGKTIGGAPIQQTAWRSIEPRELVVNIVDLEGVMVAKAE